MTDAQRVEYLNSIASKVSEETYNVPLTDDELEDVKTRIARLSISAQELNDEKEAFNASFKERMKPIEQELDSLVRDARFCERTSYGKVWYVVSHSEGLTYKVSEGQILSSRPMTRDEKQMTIQMKAS